MVGREKKDHTATFTKEYAVQLYVRSEIRLLDELDGGW